MIVLLRRTFVCLASIVLLTSSLRAQLPQTRLYALSPVGGTIGQEFEVTIIAGDDLDEVDRLVFSNPQITARQKMTDQQTPVANTFVVTVPNDVAAGVYEARVGGLFGFSNPRRFAIDHFPVAVDPADNNSADAAAPLPLEHVVNGRLESGNDVDWFRISAKQGQRIVFDVWAERLDSKMNPLLSIFDSSGRRRLDWSRNSIGYDPVLVFDVPADGDYCIKLHDVTFRNGNEYFYRLHAHTQPHLEYAWPPVGQAGTSAKITLFGYNLPGSQKSGQEINGVSVESLDVEIPIPDQLDLLDVENRLRPYSAGTDAFSYRFSAEGRVSNPIRIGISPHAVLTEVEPNNEPAAAQAVSIPVEVGGQFAEVGDVDRFRFDAKAGDVLYLEATGERLGTNTDVYLLVSQVIKQDDGTEQLKRLTAQDDLNLNLLPNVFETKTDDPVFRLQVPADGTYEALVRDRYWESRGHHHLRYSLAIRPETPDFRVVAVPTAPAAGQTWPTGLRQGDQFPVTLLAFRQDGFDGPIEVAASQLPAGLSAPTVVIGPGETSSPLIIQSATDAPAGLYEIQFHAQASIEDPALARAVPAAEKAVESAAKPIADLEKKLNDVIEKTKQPQADYDAALQAANAAPDDAELKKKVEAAQAQLDQVLAQKATAQKALDDAQATLAAAQQALESAQQALQTSTRTVEHPVRMGTVVWSTANNFPATSRVTNSMTVTVLPELAPFQVSSEAHRFRVYQSRQLLIPVTLAKRNGFDEKVALTTQGIPKNANIEFPNSALEKGESEKTLRMFVKDNAKPGLYTIWMQAQGQVGYQRNVAKSERLKKSADEAKAQADAAKAAEQAATNMKNAATTAFTQAQQTLDKLQGDLKTKEAALAQSQKQLDEAKTVVPAVEKKLQAEQQVYEAKIREATVAQQSLETQQNQLAAAEKMVKESQAALEAARAALKQTTEQIQQLEQEIEAAEDKTSLQSQLDTATQSADAQREQVAAAEKTLAESQKVEAELAKNVKELVQKHQQAGQQATAAKKSLDAAMKMVTDAKNQVTLAEQDLDRKQKDIDVAKAEIVKAQQAVQVATKAKTEAEAAEKAAQAASKTATDAFNAAQKAATDAENAAKPKNINFVPPTTAIVVEVLPAPVKLSASVPDGGKVKQGETVAVTVKVDRQNSFTGPVTLNLALPPGVSGVTAEPVEVAAEQAEGQLTIQAASDAPAGVLANVVVRATAEMDTPAEVDVPVALEITK